MRPRVGRYSGALLDHLVGQKPALDILQISRSRVAWERSGGKQQKGRKRRKGEGGEGMSHIPSSPGPGGVATGRRTLRTSPLGLKLLHPPPPHRLRRDLMLDGEGPDSPILELGDWSSELGVGATIPRWGLHNRSGASGCRSAVMIWPASWMLLLAFVSLSLSFSAVLLSRERE